MMPQVEWVPPAPRDGAKGVWDRFVGPGATPAEEWVQLGLGAAIAAGCLWLFWLQGGVFLGTLPLVVAAVLAIDLGGGVVTNATAAAKRWYHRPGHGRRAHLGFVAVHGLHLAMVALVFPGAGWFYFAATFAFLMVAAVVIVSVPLYLQRPVAMGVVALGMVGSQIPAFALPGLGWFLPLLFVKLLLAHLVREAPFTPRQTGDAA